MKSIILSFVLCLSVNAKAEIQNLDDLMTPDEIAAEAGFPRTEMSTEVLSLRDFDSIESLNVTREFPIVLIANKNASGYEAQTMRVIQSGVHTHTWKISTGREQWETSKSGRQYFTTTPPGWFYPYSIVRNHYSQTWQTNMEFSVFFNGGVALHAANSAHNSQLGRRASGGCVRLHRDNAKYIYERIVQEGKGLVPVIRPNGTVARDWRGNVIRAVKYRTLIVVEGY
ncbi:L,D-transpeptidase [Bdellovibrio bacteriovorus]|uniref:L,D-transpeptidase n=1 Tax=Bdellovibrio bacteriovorus TaxID=959 RepID=UPI0035A5C5AF